VTHKSGWKRGVTVFVSMMVLTPLSVCGATTGVGTNAGCGSYAEARLDMPRSEPLPSGPWGVWIADTDDRLTGACT